MKFFKQFDLYYFITLLFILLSSAANILATSDVAWFIILLFFFAVAISRKQLLVKDIRNIAVFSVVYVVFISVRDIAINNLASEYIISDCVFLFKYIYLAFIYCIIMREKAAAYIVKVIAHLTVISLFFFLIQLTSLREYLFNFSRTLNLQPSYYGGGYSNFIIFTYVKNLHDYRNAGFSWEPGAFSCFLIVALLLNLILNNLKFEKKSYLFIIAIITTLSTTGYLALMILLLLVYRYKVPNILSLRAVLLLLIIVIAGAAFVYIPILGDKILGTYYEDMDDLRRLKYLDIFYRRKNEQIPLNRFASMVYIYDSFGWQLILGVSNKYDVIANSKFSVNISNGVFDFLAKFGLIGLGGLVYRFGKFCMDNLKNHEFTIYCVAALLVMGFGEPTLFLPIVLIFIFLPAEQLNLLNHTQRRKKALAAVLANK